MLEVFNSAKTTTQQFQLESLLESHTPDEGSLAETVVCYETLSKLPLNIDRQTDRQTDGI